VGTGPFIYDSFKLSSGPSASAASVLRFTPNPNYWGGKPAIDNLEFHYNADKDARNFLNGTYQINTFAWHMENVPIHIPGYHDRWSEEGFIINESPVTLIYYLGMNNKQIPVAMRKAISYAFDYEYLIENYLGGFVKRPQSFIPECIIYSNWEDYDMPVLNLEIARQALVDSGLYGTLPDIDDDAAWEDLAANDPIATYNYSYRGGYIQPSVLQDNLAKIGVKVTTVNITSYEFRLRAFEIGGFHRDMIQLYSLGFGFDINDPYEICNGLFSEASYWNSGQFDDPQVQQWTDAALGETDPVAREELYENIQQRVIEELYPMAWTYVLRDYQAWAPNVRGYYPNGKNIYEFKNVYLV
jgi:ABC-type transport system substrate-binding protein